MARKKSTEVKYEVKQMEVHKKCPNCSNGYMVAIGSVEFGNNATLFPHKCDKCGHIENYKNTFPYTKYEYYEVKE